MSRVNEHHSAAYTTNERLYGRRLTDTILTFVTTRRAGDHRTDSCDTNSALFSTDSLWYASSKRKSLLVNCCILHRPGGGSPSHQTGIAFLVSSNEESKRFLLTLLTYKRLSTMWRKKLVSKIHKNPYHVLAPFVPERRSELACSLRTRRHDRTLSQRSTRLCDHNYHPAAFKDKY